MQLIFSDIANKINFFPKTFGIKEKGITFALPIAGILVEGMGLGKERFTFFL
jgi:hypothetical protein